MRIEGLHTEPRTYWKRASRTLWGRYLTRHELDALVRAAERAGTAGAALEVGAEGGRWSVVLHDLGWDITCTEVDASTLAICQERLPDARCVAVDPAADRIPADDAAVRLLVVMEVAPVSEAGWFPAEVARVLEPGGILLAGFVNSRSARAAVHRFLYRIGRRKHPQYAGPSFRSIRSALEANGVRAVWQCGLGWSPFTRASDNPLIPLATTLERVLGLRQIPTLSPFVLLIGERVASASRA